ncbi:MAG: nucleotide exchange factor GrpE [Gemmatimonadota bacterium]
MKDKTREKGSSPMEEMDGNAHARDDGPEAGTDARSEASKNRTVTPEEVEEALADAELDADLDTLQAELDELNDRHLRLGAEFNNYRRRAEAESLATWGRAQADLLRRFLDVLDDLQRVSGLDPAEEAVTVQSIVEGIDLVERKFLRVLQDSGAEVLAPESGSVFDPETMEAMMRVPTDEGEMDDRVDQVFQKGYLVDGNLVRPARVRVFKAD